MGSRVGVQWDLIQAWISEVLTFDQARMNVCIVSVQVQYPLLFPFGFDIFGTYNKTSGLTSTSKVLRNCETMVLEYRKTLKEICCQTMILIVNLYILQTYFISPCWTALSQLKLHFNITIHNTILSLTKDRYAAFVKLTFIHHLHLLLLFLIVNLLIFAHIFDIYYKLFACLFRFFIVLYW